MPLAVGTSVPITSLAISTVSALLLRMNAMVSSQPLRKPRSASGLPAIALSVAKITWMWKSFTSSPKRSSTRPSPRWTKLSACARLTMAPSTDLVFSAAIRLASSPIGTCAMPS